jgi:signal transduction histidine kinase
MMAIMQAVAYPLLWVLARSLRGAVLLNVALAFAVGIGFWVSTGDLAQAALTVALSLGFSLALGIWITSIAERSEERQRLLDELTATQDRLAAVSRDSGIASERERLAREIHDTIAQDLTGLVLLAQQARRDLGAGDPAAVDERLALIEENAAMALAETRALVAATAPVSLTTGGLREALDRLAERTTRETGIGVTVAGDASGLDRADEVVLLRCAQEGLANVRKHSGARNATLEVSVGPHGARLTVRDDGHGFDADVPWSGFGLGGMRDRLALVGGTLDVRSTDSGTELTATLPATVTP